MVDSTTMSQSHGSRVDFSTLVKAHFSALDMAAEKGASDEMEATHLRAYNQRRRLEAADYDMLQLVSLAIQIFHAHKWAG